MIADDQRSARVLVRAAVESVGVDIVEEVETAAQAIRAVAIHEPDVVVIDQMMPGIAGHEAVQAMLQTSPRSHVVVYTSLDVPGFEHLVLDAGGVFVSKLAPIEDLCRVVEDLLRADS